MKKVLLSFSILASLMSAPIFAADANTSAKACEDCCSAKKKTKACGCPEDAKCKHDKANKACPAPDKNSSK